MFAIRKGNTVTIAPLEDALVGLQSGWAIRFADKPQFLFHVSRQNLDGSSMTMDQAIGNCARIALSASVPGTSKPFPIMGIPA